MKISLSNNSSIWLQFPFLINMLIGIISLPIVLKSLGDSEYGIYILLLDIFGIISILIRSINTNFIRNIAKRSCKKIQSYYLSNYSFVFMLSFLLSFLIFIIGFQFYELKYSYILLFISFYIALYAAFLNLYSYAKMNYRKYFFIDISFSMINFSLLIIFWYTQNLTFDTLVYINLFSNGTKLILSYLMVSNLLSKDLVDKNFRLFKKELNSLKSFFIISVGTYLIFSVDSIVTSIVVDVSFVTFLVIHLKLPNMLMRMFYTFQDSKLPLYTRYLKERKYKLLYKTIIKHLGINILAVITTYVSLYFVSEFIYELWLGDSFKFDAKFYLICILIASLYSVTHYFGMVANVFHQEKITSKFIIIEGVLNVLLSVLFAKIYGVYGIVLGTLVSHILVMLSVQLYLIRKNLIKIKELENER